MKKISILILSVLLITGLFISCDNSSAIPSEELVTITFDDAHSRSLTAELEGFNKNMLFWAYTANKTDGGLSSGDTGEDRVWIHKDDPGLEGQIPGFSQGQWSFTLYGYKDEAGTNLAYQGTNRNVTLTRDSLTSNKVIVTVSPVKDKLVDGKLIIDSSLVSFKPQNTNDNEIAFIGELAQVYKVTSLDGLTEYPLPAGKTNEWSLAPGAYNVTVNFVKDDIVYGSGTVVATIYSNLTTTVKGELVELLTHVEFDSELNPDVITKTVSSDEVRYSSINNDPVKVEKVDGENQEKVSAEVTAIAAKKYIESVSGEIEGATTDNTSVVFSLNVNTTEASSTGVTYDIGMSAVATIKDGANNIAQVTKQIKKLDEAVTVKMQLQTGLTNVMVSHNLIEMSPLDSATDDSKNGFFYDINSGILIIRTDSFSPFKVEYTQPVSYAASVNNVKYLTLPAAVNAAKDGDTVKLVNDVVLNTPVIVNKTITLDFNGYSISSFESRALVVEGGKLTLTGTGTVESTLSSIENAKEYSVIRVGKGKTSTAEKVDACLIVGENVTVKSTTSYGIVVMGAETNEEVIINGNVITKERACVSGNGTDVYGGTKITINGTLTLDSSNTRGENVNAIYHPQSGELTINGTVNGGIEAKAGQITISEGARVFAESGITNHTPYNNGCSTQGYAIAAVNNKVYSGEPNFTINGGVIKGDIVIVDDDEKSDNNNATIVINGGSFTDLASAMNYSTDGATIRLAKDVVAKGSTISSGKNVTVDFGGHTYTLNKPGAGSANTETNGFQLLKDSTITFKNGTINISEENLIRAANGRNIIRLIQNYSNLTLENMTIDGTNQYGGAKYVMSFNNGTVKISGNTNIIAAERKVAFDADGNWGGYGRSNVTIDTTGTIVGNIEVGQGFLTVLNGDIKGGIVLCTSCGVEETKDQKDRISVKGGTFSSDPSEYLAQGYDVNEENGRYVVYEGTIVCTVAELQAAMNPEVKDGVAVISLANDLELKEEETWTSLNMDAYGNNVHKIVINGNEHKIKGLNSALINRAYFGNTSIEINDLTLVNSSINNTDDSWANGSTGAFIGYADSCAYVKFTNCHVKDSVVNGLTYSGGLIGYCSTPLTIENCTVTNSTITGVDVGALAGMFSVGASDVANTVNKVSVTGNTITSISNDVYTVGELVGTSNRNVVNLSEITTSGNTCTQTGSKGATEGFTSTKWFGRRNNNVTGDNSDEIEF